MSIDQLDTPLRVTWDLHGSWGSMPTPVAEVVAGRLVEGGVFFVSLAETPLAHPSCRELCVRLKDGGCALQISYGSTPAERNALEQGCPIDTLLLDAAPYLDASGTGDETAFQAELQFLRRQGLEPVVQLTPTRMNLPFLPRLLALCREQEVGKIKLPNTRADDRFCRTGGALLPTPADLVQLQELLENSADALSGVELEIHDLFLWELFHRPGETAGRSEYGGCQAANSLAHITVAGQVVACSSWPEPLGSLLSSSLAEIWAAGPRLKLRASIAKIPAGCAGCRDYQRCFGGCRGLSATLAPAGDGRDLLCAGRRD